MNILKLFKDFLFKNLQYRVDFFWKNEIIGKENALSLIFFYFYFSFWVTNKLSDIKWVIQLL